MTKIHLNRLLLSLGLLFAFVVSFNAALPPAGERVPTADFETLVSKDAGESVGETKALNGFQKFMLKRVEKKLQRAEKKAQKKRQVGELIEKNSLWSFLTAMIGIVLVLFSLIVLQSIWAMILVFGVGALIGLLLGFKGLSRFRQAPELFWGKGFAIAGIVMASLGAIYFFTGLFACMVEDCG